MKLKKELTSLIFVLSAFLLSIKAAAIAPDDGVPVEDGPPEAPGEICVVNYATGNSDWAQNDSLQTDNILLGYDITKYRILWFNGTWSINYYPGINDLDWKTTPSGDPRRVWAYFTDHTYSYCYDLSGY